MSKTWFITGASSGLGLEMTRHLLGRGDSVVAAVRNIRALEALKQVHGKRLQLLDLDVTDTPGIRKAVAEAFETAGQIDVIVSNAGYGLFGAAEELSDAQIDHQIATNLTGSIQIIRAVLPYLRSQGGGRIIQVSSEGGQIAYPNFSLYHATKWGIEGFVEAVAQEVAPFGIDFVLVEPGPTATGFGAGLVRPQPMPVYETTPAGAVRRAIDGGEFTLKGDASRTAAQIIAAADSGSPPFRLALGSSAYDSITTTLAARLALVTAQRDVAYAADRDDV